MLLLISESYVISWNLISQFESHNKRWHKIIDGDGSQNEKISHLLPSLVQCVD